MKKNILTDKIMIPVDEDSITSIVCGDLCKSYAYLALEIQQLEAKEKLTKLEKADLRADKKYLDAFRTIIGYYHTFEKAEEFFAEVEKSVLKNKKD
jgi:hypothetical protein